MRTAVLILIAVTVLSAAPAFAEDSTKGANYFNEHINKIDILNHDHRPVPTDKFQTGAGIDLVVYDNDTLELVSEGRYNLDSKVTTVYGVVKVKKSLFSMIFGKKEEFQVN